MEIVWGNIREILEELKKIWKILFQKDTELIRHVNIRLEKLLVSCNEFCRKFCRNLKWNKNILINCVKSVRNSNFGRIKENFELIIFERNKLWKNVNAELWTFLFLVGIKRFLQKIEDSGKFLKKIMTDYGKRLSELKFWNN